MTTKTDLLVWFGDWTDVLRRLLIGGRELRRALGHAASLEGLTDTEVLVVWACLCGDNSGTAQCDLAESLGMSPAQISGLVERLSTRGCLQSVGGLDRRRRHWRAAPAAPALVQAIVGQFAERARGWNERLSVDDRRTLIDLLGRLVDRPERVVVLPIADREVA